MKNRKIILISFLVCACLVVGVGYAAVSDDLAINGKGQLSKEGAEAEVNEDVYFDGVKDVVNCEASVSISAADQKDVIAVSITDQNSTLAVKNDTASFMAVVKNDSNVPVTLAFTHTASTHFEMKAVDAEGNHVENNLTVPANGSLDVPILITLLDTVDVESTGEETFSIAITATTAE